ncbi:zinc transporter 6-like isoform X2 [Homarus americanus]|uniref:zinc transporter 6-like isoform X2 n=1 Tax=Homarus americanus TaxID=6706 RepID=UPI001C45F7EA|nr:zinc transporter 6-like isoform X2 [Homarus americanus]
MSTTITLQDERTCSHSSQSDYLIGNGVRQRGNTLDCEETPREGAATLSSLQSFIKEITWLFHQREAQETLVLVLVNLLVTLLLLSWCHATRSMALMAYTYLSWFSLLSLITCLVCVWAEGQKATQSFTYGYLRCEALAVFSSVMLSLLGAVIIVKECIERLFEPEIIHTGMLSIGGMLGLVLHLGMTTLAHNPPLTQVLRASQSSLLQEHVADMCRSLCNYVPSLTRVLLPRVDPVVLISITGFLAILVDHLVLQMYNYQVADSVAALVIALLTITTMFPLCVCSASILLQTTPVSVFAQLDKCLREALTLDGVLEFRHENFWTLGVENPSCRTSQLCKDPSGFILTGSLHVRIRRDANEQMVLAHVRERLSPLVPLLTVQVFKDDWTRSSTTLQLLNDSARALATSPSHSPHYVNVTYPQVYPPTKSPTVSSSFQSQAYYPTLPRPPFSHTVPQGYVATKSPSLMSSMIPGTSTTSSLTVGISKSVLDTKTTVSIKQNRVDDELSSSDPLLYGNSDTEAFKSTPDLSAGGSGEKAVSLHDWASGSKSSIGREAHSQKPSPYYVNVDFSSRSNILRAPTETPQSKISNNSIDHSPR